MRKEEFVNNQFVTSRPRVTCGPTLREYTVTHEKESKEDEGVKVWLLEGVDAWLEEVVEVA